ETAIHERKRFPARFLQLNTQTVSERQLRRKSGRRSTVRYSPVEFGHPGRDRPSRKCCAGPTIDGIPRHPNGSVPFGERAVSDDLRGQVSDQNPGKRISRFARIRDRGEIAAPVYFKNGGENSRCSPAAEKRPPPLRRIYLADDSGANRGRFQCKLAKITPPARRPVPVYPD